jgi:hypothetical protein
MAYTSEWETSGWILRRGKRLEIPVGLRACGWSWVLPAV